MNQNQPPAPPAGFVNDQQLPPPPKPQVPGTNQPAPQTPQVPQRTHQPVTPKEPKPQLTHVMMRVGWIPVDNNAISMSADQIMTSTDEPLTFMSEGKEIRCRASAIIATKTKFA